MPTYHFGFYFCIRSEWSSRGYDQEGKQAVDADDGAGQAEAGSGRQNSGEVFIHHRSHEGGFKGNKELLTVNIKFISLQGSLQQ